MVSPYLGRNSILILNLAPRINYFLDVDFIKYLILAQLLKITGTFH